jgi:hypothetical protein
LRFEEKNPPRIFSGGGVELRDCGSVRLAPDELLTFVTPSGKEYDFTAKSWGFYATPSINGRLSKQGFKTALVKNSQDKYFIMAVEKEKMADFQKYIASERQEIIKWLDEPENIEQTNKEQGITK